MPGHSTIAALKYSGPLLDTASADANPRHGVSRNPERPRSKRPANVEENRFVEIAKGRGEGSYMTALIGLMAGITGGR